MLFEDFYLFILDNLIYWSEKQILLRNDRDSTRKIVENVFTNLYEYSQLKKQSFWNFKIRIEALEQFMKLSQVHNSIKYSLKIFEELYKNNSKFVSEGVLIICKVFHPFMFLSDNTEICGKIYSLDKKFYKDTLINSFVFNDVHTKYVNLY